jgi:hypothetical protein
MIIGKAHHQMESSMAGTTDQASHASEPAQGSIIPGNPETLAMVPNLQKGEIHQLNLGGPELEDREGLAMQA